MSYVKANKAAAFYDVSIPTLRRWAAEGKIKAKRTNGGHLLYHCEEPVLVQPREKIQTRNRKRIIYARVSSSKQLPDLQNQKLFLQQRHPEHILIEDVGSGVNFNRKGLKQILRMLFKGDVEEVVVANRDRFARIGFDFFKWIFESFDASLRSLDTGGVDESDVSSELLEIITHYTARFYGKRKYKNQNKKESDEEKKECEEGTNSEDDNNKENTFLSKCKTESDDQEEHQYESIF